MLERESVCNIDLGTEPRSKKGTMVHQALRQTPFRFTCSSVRSLRNTLAATGSRAKNKKEMTTY